MAVSDSSHDYRLIESLFSRNYPNGNGKNFVDGKINRSVNMSDCVPRVQLTFTLYTHVDTGGIYITQKFISLMERATKGGDAESRV